MNHNNFIHINKINFNSYKLKDKDPKIHIKINLFQVLKNLQELNRHVNHKKVEENMENKK
jgi:hypothetical protein